MFAIDGKSVRGARRKGSARSFLVAAFDHASGMVAAQVGIGSKGSEITAARTLPDLLDLAGAVVTMDALHTQHATAAKIRAAGAHFVLTVKANQKTLYRLLKALPWVEMPGTTSTDRGHGCRATRTIKVLQAPTWIQFEGALQVAQLGRTLTKKGKLPGRLRERATGHGQPAQHRHRDPATEPLGQPAEATRHHARDLDRPINTLLQS